jgi:HlyD family secretion protein
MKNKILIVLSVLGMLLALVTAYRMGFKNVALPPAFTPASNPYPSGVYANGIVETLQDSGENVNVYPEVAGPVVKIGVKEGSLVKTGDMLLAIDDSVQRATTAQQKAQIASARATLKTAQDSWQKLQAAWDKNHGAVSQDVLDTARNLVEVDKANLEVATRQYEAAESLLAKYQIRAVHPGRVLSINAAVGGYISSQGYFDSYTQQYLPILVMGQHGSDLAVRCFVDEILIQRLPEPAHMTATMMLRGSSEKIPLSFVRSQPNVSPKIELSNQRNERVDVRVLPLVFKIEKADGVKIYPGQLVDVYIGSDLDGEKKAP